MNVRGFLNAGHSPSLFCAFLYFDISFMVWVLLGALANSIVPDFRLNETQRGIMLALPLLGGAVLRLVLGGMTDHIGARKTGLVGLTLTMIPLFLGWLWADSYERILVVGVLLGVAGASFAAALPLASRWYPPRYQGLALIPIALTLAIFFGFAKDSPKQPAHKSLGAYLNVLGMMDTWWFCVFYSVTFGGFVGLAVFLNSFFNVQYGQSPVVAGMFATMCVISGSFLRPIGGFLADHFGGIRMLVVLYLGVAATMVALGMFPGDLYLGATLMFVCMGFLGMGNGSVFQLVPLRFKEEIGVVTGIVGAAGGIGGFFLPSMLGYLRDQTDSFSGGFYAFGATGLICAGTLVVVSRSWEGVFVGHGGKAAPVTPDSLAAPLPPAPEPVEALA